MRVSSQFPQVFAGVVLQEPICRLPTTLLGSNTLTHSLFESNTIIFLDLPMIVDLSSYEADLQQCLFGTHAGIHHTSAYPSESDPAGMGRKHFHRQAPALLNLEAWNVASFVFCIKISLLGERKDV